HLDEAVLDLAVQTFDPPVLRLVIELLALLRPDLGEVAAQLAAGGMECLGERGIEGPLPRRLRELALALSHRRATRVIELDPDRDHGLLATLVLAVDCHQP